MNSSLSNGFCSLSSSRATRERPALLVFAVVAPVLGAVAAICDNGSRFVTSVAANGAGLRDMERVLSTAVVDTGVRSAFATSGVALRLDEVLASTIGLGMIVASASSSASTAPRGVLCSSLLSVHSTAECEVDRRWPDSFSLDDGVVASAVVISASSTTGVLAVLGSVPRHLDCSSSSSSCGEPTPSPSAPTVVEPE